VSHKQFMRPTHEWQHVISNHFPISQIFN